MPIYTEIAQHQLISEGSPGGQSYDICFRTIRFYVQWLQPYFRHNKIVSHKITGSVMISLCSPIWHTDISDIYSGLLLINYWLDRVKPSTGWFLAIEVSHKSWFKNQT